MPVLSRYLYLLALFFLASCAKTEGTLTSDNVLFTDGKKQHTVSFGGLPSVMFWELDESKEKLNISIETNYFQEVDQLFINYHFGKKRCQTNEALVNKGAKNIKFDCTEYLGHRRYININQYLDVATVNVHCGDKLQELSLPERFVLSKNLRLLEASLDNDCGEYESITNITVEKKNKLPESEKKHHLSPVDVPNRSYDYTVPLQECLTTLGFDVDSQNGIAEEKIRKAILEFQRHYQLSETGEVTTFTYVQCWDRVYGWESVKQEFFNSVK